MGEWTKRRLVTHLDETSSSCGKQVARKPRIWVFRIARMKKTICSCANDELAIGK
jgi:hypothetical protein